MVHPLVEERQHPLTELTDQREPPPFCGSA